MDTDKNENVTLFEKIKTKIGIDKLGLMIALLALILLFSIMNSNFYSITNITNVARQISVLALLAVGQTLVILNGGIDLSVGSIIGVVSVVCATTMLEYGIIPAILAGLAVGALVGFINGTIIARLHVPPFIITLGMLSVARGIALILSGGMPIPSLPASFKFLGVGSIAGIPVPTIFAVIIMYIGHLLLTKTNMGRYIYAIGGNENAALLSGINVTRTKILTFMLCGLCAGLAGVVQTARVISGQPTLGEGMNLDSIAAVVIGGTSLSGGEGSMFGTFLGVIIIAVLGNGLNLIGVSSFVQMVVTGCLIGGAATLDAYYRRKRC